MKKCLYDQWVDEEIKNLNTFTTLIFKAFQAADGSNRPIILAGWPQWFENSLYL